MLNKHSFLLLEIKTTLNYLSALCTLNVNSIKSGIWNKPVKIYKNNRIFSEKVLLSRIEIKSKE